MMATEETPAQGEMVTLDKAVVKEALKELLEEIPAFRAFAAKTPPPLAQKPGESSRQGAEVNSGEENPPTVQSKSLNGEV